MPSARATASIRLPEIALPKLDLPRLDLPAALPADAAGLRALLLAQQSSYQRALEQTFEQANAVVAAAAETAHRQAMRAAHDYLIRMVEQAKLARHRLYGASSEQLAAQGRLFDEAETLAQSSSQDQDVAPLPAAAGQDGKPGGKRGRGKRGPLPAGLARVDVVHDVPEAERTCPCGSPWHGSNMCWTGTAFQYRARRWRAG